MLTFDEYLAEEMKNPAFKAEWDLLQSQMERLKGDGGRDAWEILADVYGVTIEKCEDE